MLTVMSWPTVVISLCRGKDLISLLMTVMYDGNMAGTLALA